MTPPIKPGTRARLQRSLLLGLPFLFFAVARFDYALALILIFSTITLALLPPIRTSRIIKAVIVTVILLATGGALYRFVSPCLFIVCAPTAWEAQRDTAQSTITGYGPDFAPYAVSAHPTRVSTYEFDTEPNLRISFQFIRPMPAESATTAPYQLHAIDLNDRDPFRSHEFTPGSAWLSPVQRAERAAAFANVQISPREAIRYAQADIQTRFALTANLYDTSAELLLADAVPQELQTPAVWEVTTKTYGDNGRWMIWIDARTGAVLKQTQHPN